MLGGRGTDSCAIACCGYANADGGSSGVQPYEDAGSTGDRDCYGYAVAGTGVGGDALTRRCGESDSNVGAAAYLYAFAYAYAVSYLDAVADVDGRSSDRYSDSVGDLYLDANGIVDADGNWNEHANSHGDRCTDVYTDA